MKKQKSENCDETKSLQEKELKEELLLGLEAGVPWNGE